MQRANDPPEERIKLMMAAIRDVAPPGHPPSRGMSRASVRHRRLFEQYLPALRHSQHRAEERWNGLLEGIMEQNEISRDEAQEELKATSPAGPGEDSEFIATVRRYWLKCVELNDAVIEQERVPPEEFILQWPAEVGADECVAVLTQLTYLPVGLSKEGRWM